MRQERIELTEVARFRAPSGFMSALSEVASRDLSNASEFVRRTLVAKLRECGVDLAADEARNPDKARAHAL